MHQNKSWSLFLILILALTLRLYGIHFEVPHPDDYITVQGAMHFGPAKLVPTGYGLYGLYVWPAFTLVYVQGLLFALYWLIGNLLGVFPNIESFRNLYLADPSSFFLIGRMMNVCFSLGTIWSLYYLAKKSYNHKIGLLASLFLATSFIHSFHSQFIRPDIPATFFIVLAVLSCLMILEKREPKYYLYAGILSGLAIATKFTSGLLVFLIFMTHLMVTGKGLFRDHYSLTTKKIVSGMCMTFGILLVFAGSAVSPNDLFHFIETFFSYSGELSAATFNFLQLLLQVGTILGVGFILIGFLLIRSSTVGNVILNLAGSKYLLMSFAAVLLTFVMSDPLFLLDFKRQLQIFIRDPNFLGRSSSFLGADSHGFVKTAWWYLKGPLNWGAGILIAIPAALGLLLSLYRKRPADLLIIAFPLSYFLVISAGKSQWARYVISLMPFVALYAASFLHTLLERLSNRYNSETKQNVILSLLAFGLVIPSTYNILRYDHLLSQTDTRTLAKAWVIENIPAGTKIGQDAYTGNIPMENYQITKKFSLSDKPLHYYIENNYQYLMVSDTQYNRYLEKPEKYVSNVKFYRNLFANAERVKEFRTGSELWPYPNERFSKYHIHISPRIDVYRVRKQ